MCGIVGVLDVHGKTSGDELAALCRSLAEQVRHRGPDGEGTWVDPEVGVALGHRRLAVLDLTDAGAQPMTSRCGRYVLTFNGEIYNFRELRAELQASGASFRGHSDTEVLLEAVSRWSLPKALERANGMFALGLWDRELRELTLVRDRLGEKPLYYALVGAHLVFGSRPSVLRSHPDFVGRLDRDALSLLMRLSYVPAPHTVWQGVRKLPAGHLLRVPAGARELPDSEAYWSVADVARHGTEQPFGGSDVEATDQLEALLRDAVATRLEADVPLAVFLSGGVDSSLVTALAQQTSAAPLRTLTVGVTEDGGAGDERDAAAAVAAHLGTEHEEVHLSAVHALAAVERLPVVWDEPFADPSQVPTAMLCEAARARATVCLSGDGGDEVFGGYNRYVLGEAAWQRSRRLPSWARRGLAERLLAVPPQTWDRRWHRLDRVLPTGARQYAPGTKLHKLAGVLTSERPSDAYVGLVSQWARPDEVVLGAREPRTVATDVSSWPSLADDTQAMILADTMTVLPDDMLVKVDRASMAVGLEVRAPLLDHRLVELAWTLPPSMKIRGGRGKWLLRQVADRHVPRELLDRPKLGFDPPLDEWLRGPLRAWAEDLLDARRLDDQGLFAVTAVRRVWDEHLEGRRNHGYALWTVLMVQQWLDAHEVVP